MAMIKCTECKKDVSNKAIACPNCDFAFPKTKLGRRILIYVFILIGLCYVILGYIEAFVL